MDNFTLAVVIGDAAMILTLVILILLDKKRKLAPVEPMKPAGKRSA